MMAKESGSTTWTLSGHYLDTKQNLALLGPLYLDVFVSSTTGTLVEFNHTRSAMRAKMLERMGDS